MTALEQALPLEKWSEFPLFRPRVKTLKGMSLTQHDIDRFWSRVDAGDHESCWRWTGSLCDGYGQILIFYKRVKAHRVSVYLSGREIPSGLQACHKCDNRACVNPSHIWLGTNADNVRDRDEKGRCRSRGQSGEKQWKAKLSDAAVASILRDRRHPRIIASEYEVSLNHIYAIRAGTARKASFIATMQK
jgi:hypothetical protein